MRMDAEEKYMTEAACVAVHAIRRALPKKPRIVRRTKKPSRHWRRRTVGWRRPEVVSAAKALARCVREEAVTAFLAWNGHPVPLGGARVIHAESREHGVALRVISQYRIATDETLYRFDVEIR